MANGADDPVLRYLNQLRVELARRGVAACDEALSDANEFLASERERLSQSGCEPCGASLYDHFVEVFGTPAEVADGYADHCDCAPAAVPAAARAGRFRWKRAAFAALILMGSSVGLCVAAYLQEPPTLSPFTEVRHEGKRTIVRVRGELYELVSLDEIPAAKMLHAARDHYGRRWDKRFAEDLVELLWRMKHRPGATVKLELRDMKTGTAVTIADAAMTEANRREVWRARNEGNERLRPRKLRRDEATAMIHEFATVLRQRWSYYPYSAPNIEAAIAGLVQRFPQETTTDSLALGFQEVIANGIDGHAEVEGWELEQGYLPFLIEPVGKQYVAFGPERRGFFVDGHPFIRSIDGRPISEWCRAAGRLVPKGSPGYVQRHTLRQLRNIQHWRKVLGLPVDVPIEIELASADGNKTVTKLERVAERSPTYGLWPRKESQILPGNVGYLRIAAMDVAAVNEIKKWMAQFRDTTGLVVDVRDNGGGSRDALRWLNSYLTPADEPPRVVNCAKYRLFEGFPEDQLASRFLYRADAKEWTDDERAAVAEFRKSFVPAWNPPGDKFSDWHYMVLSRIEDPAIYHYSQPVVILLNAKCFSATDVFLAAFKGRPNVTLMGTASGGSSARAETVRLANSPIRVRLGSMVSFMHSGQMFDGNGVAPDVTIEPAPEYFVGGVDNALDGAVALVKGQPAERVERR